MLVGWLDRISIPHTPPQEAKTGVRTSQYLTVIPQKNERKQGEQNETNELSGYIFKTVLSHAILGIRILTAIFSDIF